MTAVDRPVDPKKDPKKDVPDASTDHAPSKPTLSDKVAAESSAAPKAPPTDASHTDASAERIKTALSELDSGKGRSQWAIEKDLRDTLRQHTQAQLSDIEKKLGGKLEDLLGNNSHLSAETKEALRVYMQGSDHRTDADTKKLMDSAVASKNLDLLREASSIASPEARAQFIKDNGDSRLHNAFTSERDYKQAHDLATMGQVGTLTKIWADKSGVWSHWSDDKGIEAALRNMPEEERKLYQNGAKLQAGQKIDGLSNDDADRARKFYKDLNTEIDSAGNSTQATVWKAMAADGGAELLGKLAAQRGVLWNGGRSDLSSAIEGMSEQDWKYFSDPAHRQERRAAVEQTLSSIAGKDDVSKLMDQFDRKVAAQDFDKSQAQGQRGILDALQDNTHWYRNDRSGVIDAITKMSPEEQKRYREDATFKKQVDDGVAGVLKSGDSLVEAQRLLQKIHEGQQPSEDVFTKLRKNASTIIGDGAQSLRDIQEAFDKDPKFRESILHPTDDQKQSSQEFKELAARAVGNDPDKRALLDELLTKGSMPADKLLALSNGYITNDYTRAMQDLANLPEAERQKLLGDHDYLQRTIGFMDADRQKAAVEVLKSGKLGAEDQIYAAVSGAGHSGDVMEALRKLKPEELEQVRKEYERKYGGKLEDAVKAKLSGSDLTEASRILVSDKDARTKADESRDEYYSSRSGFGSWFSDTVVRSGTGLTADAAVDQQVKTVADANQHQDAQHEAAITQSQEQLHAAVDNHKESKDAIASGATDAAIGAVAIGTSIATFGGAVPLWAGVGGTLLVGAATKVGGGALFKGNDYDWTAANVIKDAGVGAINAGVSLIGPGQIAGLMGRKLLTEAAETEMTWAARTVAFARMEAYNTAAGGVGGTAGEAFNGITQWDPRKSAAENLASIGTGSATGFFSGGIGAFAMGNAFRIAGHAASFFRPSMSGSIETAAEHSIHNNTPEFASSGRMTLGRGESTDVAGSTTGLTPPQNQNQERLLNFLSSGKINNLKPQTLVNGDVLSKAEDQLYLLQSMGLQQARQIDRNTLEAMLKKPDGIFSKKNWDALEPEQRAQIMAKVLPAVHGSMEHIGLRDEFKGWKALHDDAATPADKAAYRAEAVTARKAYTESNEQQVRLKEALIKRMSPDDVPHMSTNERRMMKAVLGSRLDYADPKGTLEGDHTSDHAVKLVGKYFGEPMSTSEAHKIINQFSDAEKPAVIAAMKKRSPFLTQQGLNKQLQQMAEDIQAEGDGKFVKTFKDVENRGRPSKGVVAVVLGDSTPGHELAYQFRKATGYTVDIQVVKTKEELMALAGRHGRNGIDERRAILFDAMPSSDSDLSRLMQRRMEEGFLLRPQVLDKFYGGVNIHDIDTIPVSNKPIVEKLRSAIADRADTSETPAPLPQGQTYSQALKQAVESGRSEARDQMELQSLLFFNHQRQAFIKSLPAEVGGKQELGAMYARKMAKTFSDDVTYAARPDMVERAWMLHERFLEPRTVTVGDKVFQTARLRPDDLIFLTDVDKQGSSHFITSLYRRANGMDGAEFDPQFKTVDEVRQLNREGKLTGKKVVYLDDAIYSGSQMKSTVLPKLQQIKTKTHGIGVEIGVLHGYADGINAVETAAKDPKRSLWTRITTADGTALPNTANPVKPFRGAIDPEDLDTEIKRQAFVENELTAKLNVARYRGNGETVARAVFAHQVPNTNAEPLNDLFEGYMNVAGAHVETRAVDTTPAASLRRSQLPGVSNFRQAGHEPLFAGGKPKNLQAYDRLSSDKNVDTIIDLNLEPSRDGKFWATQTPGRRYVHMPMRPSETTADDLAKVADRIDGYVKEGKTVFVNCTRGIDRSGAAVGAYQIRHQAMTAADVMSDMRKYGYTEATPGVKHFPALMEKIEQNTPRVESSGRQVLGNDGVVESPFDQLKKQADLAHEQGDLVGASLGYQKMLDVYQHEGGLTDAQVAQTTRRMAGMAYRSGDIPAAQRLVSQSIQSLEKQPLETQEMLSALKLQKAIYEQVGTMHASSLQIDQRIALVNQRDQLLKSLPKNTPDVDRVAAQKLILHAAQDQSISPQHLSLSEPVNFAPNMKPKLVTAHLQDRDVKVLVQHLDKNAPLDQNLAKHADVIVTCHPELLPEWARAKHMFPNHTGDIEITWRNGGRDLTVVPTTPTLTAQALAQDPKFQSLRAAMLLEKKGAQLASNFKPEALVAQDYARELRRVATASGERPDLTPRREAPTPTATTGEGSMKLGARDKVPVPGATYMSGSSMSTIKSVTGLTDAELGEGKVVLEIGSGSEQELAKQAKAAGFKATVINVDPRMAWPLEKDLAESANMARFGDMKAAIEARSRGRANPEPMTVAAASHQLPIKDQSVDTIVSHLSVPMYIRYDRGKISQTLSEFARVLKVGGMARIHPIPDSNMAQMFHELDSMPFSYEYDAARNTLELKRLAEAPHHDVTATTLHGADASAQMQPLLDLEGQVYDYFQHKPLRAAGPNVQPTVLTVPEKGPVGYALVDNNSRTINDVVIKPGYGKHADQLFDDMMSQMQKEGGTWNLRFGESSYWLQDYLQAQKGNYDFRIDSQVSRDGGPLGNSYRAQISFGNRSQVLGNDSGFDRVRAGVFSLKDSVAVNKLQLAPGTELALGRDSQANIHFPDDDLTVSRKQGAIGRSADGQLYIRDDSKFGTTYVNGGKIKAGVNVPISEADKITIGQKQAPVSLDVSHTTDYYEKLLEAGRQNRRPDLVLGSLDKLAEAAHQRRDYAHAAQYIRQELQLHEHVGGMAPVDVARNTRRLAAIADHEGNKAEAQRLAEQAMDLTEKLPLENLEQIRSIQLYQKALESNGQSEAAAKLNERITELNKREELLKSLPAGQGDAQKIAAQAMVLQAADDPALRPVAWTSANGESLSFPPDAKPRLVTLQTDRGPQKVLLQHFDSKSPLDLNLAREADVIATCHPELLPEWARAKHLFPNHDGDIEVQWNAAGTRGFFQPITPKLNAASVQDPRFSYLTKAIQLDAKRAELAAKWDQDSFVARDYARDLRKAALTSGEVASTDTHQWEHTGNPKLGPWEISELSHDVGQMNFQIRAGDNTYNLYEKQMMWWHPDKTIGPYDSTGAKVRITTAPSTSGNEFAARDFAMTQQAILKEIYDKNSRLHQLLGTFKTMDPELGIASNSAQFMGRAQNAKMFTMWPRQGVDPRDLAQEVDNVLQKNGLGFNKPMDESISGNVEDIVGNSNRVAIAIEKMPVTSVTVDNEARNAFKLGPEIESGLNEKLGLSWSQKPNATQLRALEEALKIQKGALTYDNSGNLLLVLPKNEKVKDGFVYLTEAGAGDGFNHRFEGRKAFYSAAKYAGVEPLDVALPPRAQPAGVQPKFAAAEGATAGGEPMQGRMKLGSDPAAQVDQLRQTFELPEGIGDGLHVSTSANGLNSDIAGAGTGAIIIDRKNDPILAQFIDRVRKRAADENITDPHDLMLLAAEETNNALNPNRMGPRQIDDWWAGFQKEHPNEQISLGQAIEQQRPGNAESAVLFKVLSDELGLDTTLVHGQLVRRNLVPNQADRYWVKVKLPTSTRPTLVDLAAEHIDTEPFTTTADLHGREYVSGWQGLKRSEFANGSVPEKPPAFLAAETEDQRKMAQLLSEGEIVNRNRILNTRFGQQVKASGQAAHFGYIEKEEGGLQHVITRHGGVDMGTDRVRQELGAYYMHVMGPFEHYHPVTVLRPGGELVQERVGDSFNNRTPALERVLQSDAMSDPTVRSQLEQALVERTILGDQDTHLNNFVVTKKNGKLSIANIDMDVREGTGIPAPPNSTEFDTISASTMDKIHQWLAKFDSTEGRAMMESAGFAPVEIDGAIGRARWLAENGRFPTSKEATVDGIPVSFESSSTESPIANNDPTAIEGRMKLGGAEDEAARAAAEHDQSLGVPRYADLTPREMSIAKDMVDTISKAKSDDQAIFTFPAGTDIDTEAVVTGVVAKEMNKPITVRLPADPSWAGDFMITVQPDVETRSIVQFYMEFENAVAARRAFFQATGGRPLDQGGPQTWQFQSGTPPQQAAALTLGALQSMDGRLRVSLNGRTVLADKGMTREQFLAKLDEDPERELLIQGQRAQFAREQEAAIARGQRLRDAVEDGWPRQNIADALQQARETGWSVSSGGTEVARTPRNVIIDMPDGAVAAIAPAYIVKDANGTRLATRYEQDQFQKAHTVYARGREEQEAARAAIKPSEASTIEPAGSRRSNDIAERMQNAPIKLHPKSEDPSKPRSRDIAPHETVSGYFEDNGQLRHVLIREKTRPAERQAGEFHKLTEFTSSIPVAVTRDMDSLSPEIKEQFPRAKTLEIQERSGKSLSDRLSRGSLSVDDDLRDQMEQATAERAIIGDNDFNPGNQTVSRVGGKSTIGNIDFGKEGDPFPLNGVPITNFSVLKGQPISESTLAKIDKLVGRLTTSQGRAELRAIGLTDAQSDALILRAQYLLEHKQFPESFDQAVADPNLASKYLQNLEKSSELKVKLALAKSPSLTPEMMRRLAKDFDPSVVKALTANPNLPPELLNDMMIGRYDIMTAAARQANLTESQRAKLLNTRMSSIDAALGENPSIDAATLAELATRSVEAKMAVAANPSTSVDLLRQLAKNAEKHGWVQAKVASNPHCPPDVLDELSRSQFAQVKEAAISNPALSQARLAELATSDDPAIKQAVAKNPALSLPLLEKLATDAGERVRTAVAENPNSSPALLEKLASDPVLEIRKAVAANPNTPQPVLNALLRDMGDEEDGQIRAWRALNVRSNARSNPSLWKRAEQSETPATSTDARPEIRETVPPSLPSAQPEVRDPVQNLRRAMTEGREVRTFVDHDATVHVIADPDGVEHEVILANAGQKRINKELAVQELHRMSGFTTDFPATVDLGDNKMAQAYMGQSLENKTTAGVMHLYNDDPSFRESFQQAMVERLIYGDPDTHLGNFTVYDVPGQMRVANIDVEQAFMPSPFDTPAVPQVEFLRGQQLSLETLGKIQQFVRTIEQSRAQLRSLNLTDDQINKMVSRARWFLENQRLPVGR